MRVLSTLAIRAGLRVVTLPRCAKWLIGDSFLFRSEMCESRRLVGEGAELPKAVRRVRGPRLSFESEPLTRIVARSTRNEPPSPARGEGKRDAGSVSESGCRRPRHRRGHTTTVSRFAARVMPV